MKAALALCLTLASALPAMADAVVIVAATAYPDTSGWAFDVTLRHPDTGWDHYADAWEVLAPNGTSLGLRTLGHPHVDEQPFTRSLSGINIPDDMAYVTIRARCLVDGWSVETLRVNLKR